jgi:hypothetical protein
VAAESDSSSSHADIDRAMAAWRQGDCALGEHWFVHRFDPTRPLTAVSHTAADEPDVDLAEEEVRGLVVVTQTCDVVRSCGDRPYVEVCPVVAVEVGILRQIQRGHRPAFATIATLANSGLVADLDRTMTVEKAVVAGWTRVPGWHTDAEARDIATALARKRSRFAFPDDFTALMKDLVDRLSGKHDKNTIEGQALRGLREIRVHAAPSWDATSITLTLWFIRSADQPDFDGSPWPSILEHWMKLISKSGRYTQIFPAVVVLDDLTATDYVHSDRLDLDHLSSRRV